MFTSLEYKLTPCMLGNFSCFCCQLLTFSKLTISKISFRNTIRVSNRLDQDQDRHNFGPDLGPIVSKGYQQMTKVAASKERAESICLEFNSASGNHCHMLMNFVKFLDLNQPDKMYDADLNCLMTCCYSYI